MKFYDKISQNVFYLLFSLFSVIFKHKKAKEMGLKWQTT